jgi:hypothetical protein
MTTPRPATTVFPLTRRQCDHAIARGDYLAVERDLYRELDIAGMGRPYGRLERPASVVLLTS